MIEDKENGIKIAESPEEKLVHESIENTEKAIVRAKLEVELMENTLEYLKTKL